MTTVYSSLFIIFTDLTLNIIWQFSNWWRIETTHWQYWDFSFHPHWIL